MLPIAPERTWIVEIFILDIPAAEARHDTPARGDL